MAVADANAALGIDQAQKLDHVVKVVKRLTDAHHDNAADACIGVMRCQILLRCNDLTDQLTGCQIAHTPANGGGAEAATHAAAHLRGNADGGAVLVVHDNGFHAVAVRELKEVFDSAVNGGNQSAARHGQVIACHLFKLCHGFLAHVGDLVGRKTLMQALKKLACAVFGLPDLPHQGFQLFGEQGENIFHKKSNLTASVVCL